MAANPPANPFDQFDAPAANPFDQFDTKSGTGGTTTTAPSGGSMFTRVAADQPASFSQPDDTATAPLDPRTATMGDYLVRAHQLASGLGQIGQTALDYGRVAGNTYGNALDRSLADQSGFKPTASGQWVQGGDIPDLPAAQATALAAEQAKTAAASERLGTAGTIAAHMTGAGPLGKITEGVGTAIAPYVGPLAKSTVEGAAPVAGKFGKWAGGVLGSGAVNAGATATSEVAGGESLSPWDIGVSGVFGLAGGATGGVVGRGGKLASPVSADDLHAVAQDIYKPLDNVLFNTGSEVKPEFDAFRSAIGSTTDLTGKRLGQAKATSAILEDLEGTPQLTGRNLQEAQRSLDKIAASPSSTVQDQEYAPKLKAALQNVMDNGLPFSGVPAGEQATGYAGRVQKAGDVFHGRAEDIDTLNTMVQKSQSGNKPDVGAQMGAYMNSNQGMGFLKPGMPQYDAANTLSDTAQKPLTSGQGLTLWDLKHHLLWPAVGLAGAQTAGAFGTTEGHQPWWANIPEDIVGLGAGFVLKNRLNAAGALAQQRALDAYRTTASTGIFQAPALPTAPLRDTIRRIIYGQGTAGKLPGQ